MGNTRNRTRKRSRITPSKQAKKPKRAKHGDSSVDARGPSAAKIGNQSATYYTDTENVDVTKEGTIFMPGCIPCIQHAEVTPRKNLSTPHFIKLSK